MQIKNKIYLIIFLGLLFSTILSFYYVSKYDTYEMSSDNFENHQMIKSDVAKFWRQANDLKNDLNNGVSFFKTGYEYRIPYLPPKILFFLSSLINLEFFDKIEKIKIDKKKVILCDDYGKESYIPEVEKAIHDFTRQNSLEIKLIENRFAEIVT